jgi:hypothetical protein
MRGANLSNAKRTIEGGVDKMTQADTLHARFETIETKLAYAYFLLHQRFLENAFLSRFWAEVAMEELQHASVLRFCRRHHLTNEVDIDLAAAGRVEDLLNVVKRIVVNPDVTIDEAFYASLLMESSELDEIYRKLTLPLARDHRLLYEALESSLRLHHDRFAHAAQEFLSDRAYVDAFRNLIKTQKTERKAS